MKLTKNKINTILVTISFALSLESCARPKENNTTNYVSQDVIIQAVDFGLHKCETVIDNTKPEISQIKADSIIDSYMYSLSEEFDELKELAVEKWNSEEFQEKLTLIKQKLSDLVDFVFNGKEINGVTFDELSDTAKEKVKFFIQLIDAQLESLIPNYQDRFYNWLVGLGTDGLELWDELNETFNNYQNDVLDEYNSRTADAGSRIIVRK